MEGATGVTHPEDVIPGCSQYERFRHLLTGDVNAAIEGAAGAGAASFLVNEAHDGMRNLLLKDLDPRAELIVGQRKPLVMMEGIEGSDVAFLRHRLPDVRGRHEHCPQRPRLRIAGKRR